MNPRIVENVLDRAGDWFRFDGWSWLVASEYTAHDITNAIKTALTNDDSILLIKCDASIYSGFAPQATWDWLSKYTIHGLASVQFGPPGLGGGIPTPNALAGPFFKKS
jgi:hypothetical protein